MSTRLEDAELLRAIAPVANRIQLLLELTIRQVLAEEPLAGLEVQHDHVLSRLRGVAPGYLLDELEVRHVLERSRAA